MSFIKGSVACAMHEYACDGDVSKSLMSAKMNFKQPTQLQETASGIVSAVNPTLDAKQDASACVDDYVFCDFRLDQRRVSNKLVTAEAKKRLGKIVSKEALEEEKDKVRTELISKTLPSMASYPLLFNTTRKLLAIGNGSDKVCDALADHIKIGDIETTRLSPIRIATQYAKAYGEDADIMLGSAHATCFTDESEEELDKEPSKITEMNEVDASESIGFFGHEFLTWLISMENNGVELPGNMQGWLVDGYDQAELVTVTSGGYSFNLKGKGASNSKLVEKAVREGGLVSSCRITLCDQFSSKWKCGIRANLFINGLRLPVSEGDGEDTAGTRLTRSDSIFSFWALIRSVFDEYLKLRIDPEKWAEEKARVAAWANKKS